MSHRSHESKRSEKRHRKSTPAKGLTTQGTTNRFRLVGPPTLFSSTGGGILTGYIGADPSGGTGSTWTATEWADLIALYSEVRLISFTCKFMPPCPADTTLNPNLGNVLAISTVLSTVAANPASYQQVNDNSDCKLWCMMSTTDSQAFAVTLRPRSPLNFAVVTAANPGSYAGCPGSIQFFGSAFTASQPYLYVAMEGVYEFRSRI